MATPSETFDVDELGLSIVRLSQWIDEGNAGRPPEAETWARVAKVAEEAGEVIAAQIGATGQNPRKGVSHSVDDVEEELLDVAVTALAAVEHLRGHDGRALELLADKVARIIARARTASIPLRD
ncbi:MAG: MazG-like family protein [Arachnia sp.]